MKLLIISLIALSSCTKTWNCTITTTSPTIGTWKHYTEIEGTAQDKNEYEAVGTQPTDSNGISQHTECN